jgi:hypothetical protein
MSISIDYEIINLIAMINVKQAGSATRGTYYKKPPNAENKT